MTVIEKIKSAVNTLFKTAEPPKNCAAFKVKLESFSNRNDLLLVLYKDLKGFPDDVSEAAESKYIEDGDTHYPITFHNLNFGNYLLALYTSPDYKGDYQKVAVAYPRENKKFINDSGSPILNLEYCLLKVNAIQHSEVLDFIDYKRFS